MKSKYVLSHSDRESLLACQGVGGYIARQTRIAHTVQMRGVGHPSHVSSTMLFLLLLDVTVSGPTRAKESPTSAKNASQHKRVADVKLLQARYLHVLYLQQRSSRSTNIVQYMHTGIASESLSI